MPLMNNPTFSPSADKLFEIANPGSGGINMADLEFKQNGEQSPYMKNMMYRNGVFGKRYGQSFYQFSETYNISDVMDMVEFDEYIVLRTSNKFIVFKREPRLTIGWSKTELEFILLGGANVRGMFIRYAHNLYYLAYENGIYQFKFDDTISVNKITPYVPDLVINRSPDPEKDSTTTSGHTLKANAGDLIDDYNMLGNFWKNTFHGTGTDTVFKLTDTELDEIDPTVWIGGEDDEYLIPKDHATYGWTFDHTKGTVTFNTAPIEGTNNVIIKASKTDTSYAMKLYSSTICETYGGSNNSRLFLAGGGEGLLYYSYPIDITYFPESNYMNIGNTDGDITGLGKQYNALFVFKRSEVHQLTYYVLDSSTTTQTKEYGKGAFTSKLVNANIGCCAPRSICLINNRLTWLSDRYGVCTLNSTNIQDERNILPISGNVNHSNKFGIMGILDDNNLFTRGTYKKGDQDIVQRSTICAFDYEGKYILINNTLMMAYVWDYELTPFYYTGKTETDSKRLAWYIFDKFYCQYPIIAKEGLMYSGKNNSASILTTDHNDYGDGIESFYMTPFLQFGAVECLKNVKNIYVQCRGDTASVIDMYYYTDEDIKPEHETEAIRIGGKLWHHFEWSNFQWLVVNWANTFRRKCSLKKIQMASFYFENKDKYEGDELVYNCAGRDMSITHIGLQYQLVKYIK